MIKKIKLSDDPKWMEAFNVKYSEALKRADKIEEVKIIENKKGKFISTKDKRGSTKLRKLD